MSLRGVRNATAVSAVEAPSAPVALPALVAALGVEHVAVPLSAVAAVVAAPPAVPLPAAPAYLRGVVVWQGQLVPLLDVAALVDLEAPPAGGEAVVLRQGEAELAVPDVESIPPAPDAAALPVHRPAVADAFGRPARAADGAPVRLLDVAALFAIAELTAVLG
ncbi:MAG: chemotaxis protein CheW [Chloroflexi bacterium]|nr:chemotaxis protein CheW [Chloroflexota bacterium]